MSKLAFVLTLLFSSSVCAETLFFVPAPQPFVVLCEAPSNEDLDRMCLWKGDEEIACVPAQPNEVVEILVDPAVCGNLYATAFDTSGNESESSGELRVLCADMNGDGFMSATDLGELIRALRSP